MPPAIPCASGSPPRARGQHVDTMQCDCLPRFTPACAGTTSHLDQGGRFISVHPRVRGDNMNPVFKIREQTGSPPRARGQRTYRESRRAVVRFTPACAGTTHTKPDKFLSVPGSPPRARGQHQAPSRSNTIQRFTPACAGTTSERFTPACAGTTARRLGLGLA